LTASQKSRLEEVLQIMKKGCIHEKSIAGIE
jgi:hypothetical protein